MKKYRHSSFNDEAKQYQIYLFQLPKLVQFYVFLKSGWYNGSFGKIQLKRIWCFFNKHVFPEFKYYVYKNGVKTDKYYKQCKYCGIASYHKFENEKIKDGLLTYNDIEKMQDKNTQEIIKKYAKKI